MSRVSSLNAAQTVEHPVSFDLDTLFFPPPHPINYQRASLAAAGLISAMGASFYIVSNKNAPKYALASSVSANLLIGFYVIKESIDLFDQLIKEKKYGKAFVIAVIAAALYIPQVLITIMESNYSKAVTIFFAIATGLSGVFLSAYGVSSAPALLRSLKNKITQDWSYALRYFFGNQLECIAKIPDDAVSQRAIKSNVLVNLKMLLTGVQASDNYRGMTTLQFNSIEELLVFSRRIAKEAANSCVNTDHAFFTIAKWLCQIALILSTVYPFFAYVCATDKSIRNNFHFSPNLSALSANFLLSYYFIMAVKGALSTAENIFSIFSMWSYGRTLSNSMKIGGGILVPLMAIGIASFSGGPTREFAQTCESSKIKSLVTFPHYADVMSYDAIAFNSIYTGMALMWFARYFLKNRGDAWNNEFLVLVNALQQLTNLVQTTSANDIPQLLTQLGSWRKSDTIGHLNRHENDEDDDLRGLQLSPTQFFRQYVEPEVSQPTEQSPLLQA